MAISGKVDPRQWRNYFGGERLAGFYSECVPGDLPGGDAKRVGRSFGRVASHAPRGDVLCVYAEFGPGHEHGFDWNHRRGEARGFGSVGSRRSDRFPGGDAGYESSVDDGGWEDGLPGEVKERAECQPCLAKEVIHGQVAD